MKDIIVDNVRKAYGDNVVLDSFSCIIPGGRVTCIDGPSGCGKTTLLNIISGLEKPDSGSVSGVPSKISFVFQEDRLCESFNAVSNVRMVCSRFIKDQDIEIQLSKIGIDNMKVPVRDFSGGMKRRVAIVRAVCYNADCVFLDEPFKGLDDETKKTVMDYVLKSTEGKTVICVTHDKSEALYLGSDFISMDKICDD